MPFLKTFTLGCKVNQYETELVREGFSRAGFSDTPAGKEADLCVVNTCTVTGEGDAKSRQLIRRLARENPAARLIVMGCYATRAPEELAALPNVSEIITDKREIPDLLGRFGVIDLPTGISHFAQRHRAYVKVQDGCLLRCSYCIIPYVRPHISSRPVQHIVEEVARLRDNGYREIILTGVHLGHYGVEGNWNRPREEWLRLSTLLRELMKVPGNFRVRLSSIEATELSRDLISVLADHPDRICPHLHICLQSGSDDVLRRMRRRWSSRTFISRCDLIRKALDCPAFTTDVIVGFPGETEADFAATCQVAREVGFSKIHGFSFSARQGTPAAQMKEQVPSAVKSERMVRLLEVEAELRREYLTSLIGKTIEVLAEGINPENDQQLLGTSCRYSQVGFPRGEHEAGDLVRVIPQHLEPSRLRLEV